MPREAISVATRTGVLRCTVQALCVALRAVGPERRTWQSSTCAVMQRPRLAVQGQAQREPPRDYHELRWQKQRFVGEGRLESTHCLKSRLHLVARSNWGAQRCVPGRHEGPVAWLVPSVCGSDVVPGSAHVCHVLLCRGTLWAETLVQGAAAHLLRQARQCLLAKRLCSGGELLPVRTFEAHTDNHLSVLG